MALEARLVQKLSQNLLMTPQLQQAIKLLQLGRLEYLEAIQKELLENPLLEEMKEESKTSQSSQDFTAPETGEQNGQSQAFEGDSKDSGNSEGNSSGDNSENTSPADKEAKVDWEDYLDSFTDSRGTASPKGLIDFEDRPSGDANLTRTESLSEHLLSQIRLSDMAERDREVAVIIIGNLDKNGYLEATHEEIAQDAGCSVDDVIRVIELMRQFDPSGVAARNLQECLEIQLDSQGLGESLEAKIVRNHLDKLEKRKFDQIAKAEQVALEQVYKAITTIKKLEPRPGRPFAEDPTRYVIPDIYVYKVGGEYVITLNEDGMPRLRVSPYYMQILKGDGGDNANKSYLNERLKAASWLIKSILQRQQTIYKVTESIVKFQKDFLDHGISKLKPLVLKDVAEDISMHESTVSRVTTNKYVHTPQGVFELKYFFTTGIKTAEGDVSSSSIKEKIRAIIAAEDQKDPISDQAIVDLLKKENVDIARRTVAKYREGLGIESSSRRKKLF